MSRNYSKEIQPLSQPNIVLENSTIHWRNNTPVNHEFDDSYYSDEHGPEESKYVFIDSNRLPDRWQEINQKQDVEFSIVETGFGSGLNFFNVARAWNDYQSQSNPNHLKKLVYTSIEGFPLKKIDLRQIINNWARHFPASQLALTSEVLEVYPQPIKGIYQFQFGSIELNLFFMRLDQALSEFRPKGKAQFDCLFLDGFSPAKNAAMWHSSSLRQLSFLCKQGATFSTFTAASRVRRELTHCGFLISRQKGYGRKREMLTGTMQRKKYTVFKPKTPWYHHSPDKQAISKAVVIIGGGVAGCATANALAQQGINCLVLEQNKELGGTSGRLKRSLYSPHLSADFNLSSQFYWHAYHHLSQYLLATPEVTHDQSGIFFIADNDNRKKYLSAVHRLFENLDTANRWLVEKQSQDSIGISIDHPGLFSKEGGWLNGHSLCENLVNHNAIRSRTSTAVENILGRNDSWVIETSTGAIESSHVVFCTGWATDLIERFKLCRLDKIKGQTTSIAGHEAINPLNTILNNGHYLIPGTLESDTITVGASYQKISRSEFTADVNADIENLSAFKNINLNASRSLNDQLEILRKNKKSDSSTGIRLCTRDHLPILGPVPDMEFFINNYTQVIQSGRLKNCPSPKNVPGLFVNTAHGSRGVTASILSGKLISAMITGKFIPLPGYILEALHPARFFVRDQIKNNNVRSSNQ